MMNFVNLYKIQAKTKIKFVNKKVKIMFDKRGDIVYNTTCKVESLYRWYL